MINVCQSPGVVSMSADRSFLVTEVILEWVGRACPLPCKGLFIHSFVALGFQVKSPLADRLERALLRAFEVFAVSSTFWRTPDGIVMSFKYLVNEGYRLRRNFSVPSALRIWQGFVFTTAIFV